MEDKNLTFDDLNDDQKDIINKKIPSKYYDYKLKGAIIHIGTSEQGHYISIIQDRENPLGKWYEFNDHQVREFDPADIPNEAFGGDDDTFLGNMNI
jgi:ubiquitin C-terminal hydrolase